MLSILQTEAIFVQLNKLSWASASPNMLNMLKQNQVILQSTRTMKKKRNKHTIKPQFSHLIGILDVFAQCKVQH